MKRVIRLLMLSLILIIGAIQCEDVAPDDAEITINPTSGDYKNTTDEFFHQTFTISVKDSKGVPLNGVEITIEFVWAPNYSCPEPNCVPVLKLIDKDNKEVSSPFTTRTLDNGTYPITLRLYASGYSYEADLVVRSGTAYASAKIKMNQ